MILLSILYPYLSLADKKIRYYIMFAGFASLIIFSDESRESLSIHGGGIAPDSNWITGNIPK